MKRYSDRGPQMNFAQRFRYSNLAQMYTKYREIFRKRMKQKRGGSVQRHFGAAAREIENLRKQSRPPNPRSGTSQSFPFAISCQDPDHERKKWKTSMRLPHAKEQAGEETGRLTLEAFQQFCVARRPVISRNSRARAKSSSFGHRRGQSRAAQGAR